MSYGKRVAWWLSYVSTRYSKDVEWHTGRHRLEEPNMSTADLNHFRICWWAWGCVRACLGVCVCVCVCARARVCLVSELCLILLWPYEPQPSRLLCPWDFPGKTTAGLPFPFPGYLPHPGIESTSLWVSCIGRWVLLPLRYQAGEVKFLHSMSPIGLPEAASQLIPSALPQAHSSDTIDILLLSHKSLSCSLYCPILIPQIALAHTSMPSPPHLIIPTGGCPLSYQAFCPVNPITACCGFELCSPRRYVQVLNPSILECDLIWN